MYSRFLKILEKSLQFILMSLTGTIIIIITYQVFGRYILNQSPSWAEEVARILLVWICFFGSSLLVRNKRNIKLEIVVKKYFSGTVQKKLNLATEILIILFSPLTLKFGLELMIRNLNYTTEALHLPMSYFTLPIPVASFFTILFSIGNIFQEIGILRSRG